MKYQKIGRKTKEQFLCGVWRLGMDCGAALCMVAVAAILSGCNVNILGGPSQGQEQEQNPTPGATPSPSSSACDVKVVHLGAAGDDFQLQTGGADSVDLVVTLLGTQGVELKQENCASEVPSYSPSGPCSIEGAGFNAKVRGSAPGACTITARVKGVSSLPLSLTVVP
jgi:hypothetical protein